jgi:endonuclease/exonuclease/phosphatase family metal-dependent hydrolase
MLLWWVIRVDDEKRPTVNPTPILILVSAAVLLVLTLGDYFTYTYAYVRDVAAPFTFVEELMRGMRDLGLGLALAAAVLACLPMILERQIIPWRQGKLLQTIFSSIFMLVITVTATRAAIPDPILRPTDPVCLRAMTLNMHGGYSQYFSPNLEDVAELIRRSGVSIVLLQEVESGLLISGSTDQALWLADELDMNVTFYPQNEDTQGIAVLSRLDIVEAEGAELTSSGPQAAVQYVQYQLDADTRLHVYNMWLGFLVEERNGQPIPQEVQDQVLQMDEVYRLVAANHFINQEGGDDRVLMGGTFNFGEDSPLYDRWNGTVFQDPFIRLFDEERNTLFLVDGRQVRYDYLWLLNLEPYGILIDDDELARNTSDHRPSIVEFSWIPGQTCD